jgi:hypothetical protein
VAPFKDRKRFHHYYTRDDREQFHYCSHTHLSGSSHQVSGQAGQVVGGEGHGDVRLVRQQVLLLA